MRAYSPYKNKENRPPPAPPVGGENRKTYDNLGQHRRPKLLSRMDFLNFCKR